MPNLLKPQNSILYKNEVYNIIGAAMAVHNELGSGFLEAVYAEALELEFQRLGIPYQREVNLKISYKGKTLTKEYQADFLCHDKIVIELKAINNLDSSHESQVLNYLKVTGYKLGLLINFGQNSLLRKRIIKEI